MGVWGPSRRIALKTCHALISCLLAILLLSACGSSSERGDDDFARIDEAIRTAALVHRPAECTKVATQGFLEQVTNRSGEAAVLICEEEAEDPLGKADAVAVSTIVVTGSTATAKAAFSGLPGPPGLRRETVSIALVEEDGRWKLDRLTGYRGQQPDVEKIAEDIAADSTRSERDCFERRIDGESRAEHNQGELSRPFSRARLDDQYAICFKSNGAGSGHGQTIAPKDGLYSYRVPPGFEPFTPRELDGTTTTALTSLAARNSSAGISVVQVEEFDIFDAKELDEFRDAFVETVGEEADSKGSSLTEVARVPVPGHLALQYTLIGGRAQQSPGVDEEATLIVTSNGLHAVKLICAWGRTAVEERLIRHGCEAVLRSLQVE